MLTRRSFAKLVLASLASAFGPPGCTRSSDYSDDDAARLAKQMADEVARSGTGPYGPLRFQGYRGLAQLPYFTLDEQGQLRIRVDDLPPVIDCHTHLGWSQMLAPQVDLLQRAPRTQYYLDCDRQQPPCALDLDVYVNANFTDAMHRELSHEVINSLLVGSRAAATHTIPNLLAEMDAVGVAQAAVLPIAAGLPFDNDPTLHVLDAIHTAGVAKRLIPFASVHPRDTRKREQLRDYARRGVRGVKLHPEMQRFNPDDAAAMEIYEECGRLKLPVIFHAGRSGIEPGFIRPYALIRHYIPAIKTFPHVRFILGHAGARDVADAIPVAQQHDNVWLEISGQGVTQLDELLRVVGEHKLLFGTDWPFYPLAVTLAKVLIVTEKRESARRAILAGNATEVLKRET
jgi:predicted TIM-barrel fold metal-dependent hydrolase